MAKVGPRVSRMNRVWTTSEWSDSPEQRAPAWSSGRYTAHRLRRPARANRTRRGWNGQRQTRRVVSSYERGSARHSGFDTLRRRAATCHLLFLGAGRRSLGVRKRRRLVAARWPRLSRCYPSNACRITSAVRVRRWLSGKLIGGSLDSGWWATRAHKSKSGRA